MLWQKVGAVTSISHVLDASFDALGRNSQEKFMTMAVLPKAAAAPMEMLMNLWELEVSQNSLFFVKEYCGDHSDRSRQVGPSLS